MLFAREQASPRSGLEVNLERGNLYGKGSAWPGAVTHGRGAYLANLEPCPSCLVRDGDVDLADFTTFSQCSAGRDVGTPPPSCDPCDFSNADLDGAATLTCETSPSLRCCLTALRRRNHNTGRASRLACSGPVDLPRKVDQYAGGVKVATVGPFCAPISQQSHSLGGPVLRADYQSASQTLKEHVCRHVTRGLENLEHRRSVIAG